MKKSALCLAIGLLTLGGSSAVFANSSSTHTVRNNHQDRAWGGILPPLNGYHYTNPATKTDKTSGYIKLNSIGKGGVNALMQRHDGEGVASAVVDLKSAGDWKYVSNYAFEEYGQVDVRMAIKSDYWNIVNVEAHGVWSPDSV